MPEDSSISHKEDPEKLFEFECPACGMMEVKLRYSQGVAEEIFVEVRCRTCGENGFFQLFEGGFGDPQKDQLINHLDKKGEEIQQEWREWYQFKIRHLSQQTKKVNLGPIQGNEPGISLKDVRTSKLSQGIKNESQLRSLSDLDLTDLQSAKDSSELIDQAIDEISKYRAKIGAFQKNTVERNMNTLKVAAETATQGESVIRDTDMAAEMSKLTSDQILLSASQSMLSQANQLPRNVLQLLESE